MIVEDGTGHTVRLETLLGVGAYSRVFRAKRVKTSLLAASSQLPSSSSPSPPSIVSPKSKSSIETDPVWEKGVESGVDIVALKEIPFDEAVDDVGWTLREASNLSLLHHPNVVRFIASFTHNGISASSSSPISLSLFPSLCIVQEYINGFTIAQLLSMYADKNERVDESYIAAVLYDVLQGLLYIHESSRLVHRDIKSMNLVVSPTSKAVKICDLGASAEIISAESGRRTVIGTIGWIAPEVLRSGSKVTASQSAKSHSYPSDVWSLGVSVLEMAAILPATNDLIFKAYVDDLSLRQCSVQPDLRGPSSFINTEEKIGSAELVDFISCCLRLDPQMRPTVRQLLSHPFLSKNHAEDEAIRHAAIAHLTEQMRAAGHSEGVPSPASLAKPSVPKQMQREAVLNKFQGFADIFTPASTSPAQREYEWNLPQRLRDMPSSMPFRFMPSYNRPNGIGAVPREDGSVPPDALFVKPLFDSVVLPASIESQKAVQRVFAAHRKFGYNEQKAKEDAFGGAPDSSLYSNAELCGSSLTYERHLELHDKLLRSFQAVCAADPSFTQKFCTTFATALQNTDRNVSLLAKRIAHLEALQQGPINNTHVKGVDTAFGRYDADSQRHNTSSNAHQLSPSVCDSDLSGLSSRASAQPAGPTRGAEVCFDHAEDWLRVPRMPQCGRLVNDRSSVSVKIADPKDGTAQKSRSPPAKRYVDPGPFLYNRWLKKKQESVLNDNYCKTADL